MFKDFKEFAIKGNMMDLAIGVIIGGAFGKIITSIVNDLIMPVISVIISLIIGKADFTNMYFALNGPHYATIVEAKKNNVATLSYGLFLSAVIDFLIVAFTIFFVVKQLNRFKKKEKPVASKMKECPYCKTNISIEATRCPNCTSQL